MMNIVKNLGLATSLLCISAASIAADCNHLISLGSQKSVIPAAKNISMTDVTACLATCSGYSSDSAINQCSSSLQTLAYAINYNNALSGLSPQQFSNAPISPNSVSSTLPEPTNNQPSVTTQSASETQTAPTALPNNGYIMTPQTDDQSKQKKTKSTGIRWF